MLKCSMITKKYRSWNNKYNIELKATLKFVKKGQLDHTF
jgi:hypothetical protein